MSDRWRSRGACTWSFQELRSSTCIGSPATWLDLDGVLPLLVISFECYWLLRAKGVALYVCTRFMNSCRSLSRSVYTCTSCLFVSSLKTQVSGLLSNTLSSLWTAF